MKAICIKEVTTYNRIIEKDVIRFKLFREYDFISYFFTTMHATCELGEEVSLNPAEFQEHFVQADPIIRNEAEEKAWQKKLHRLKYWREYDDR